MTPVESLVVQTRPGNNTGLGTSVFSADSTAVKAFAPSLFMQDSRVVMDRLLVNITVLATTVDMPIFIPTFGIWVLDSCSSVRRVVGSDGSAVTADIMVAASGTAPASGTTQLSAVDSINLKAPAADVVIAHALATTLTECGPGSQFSLNVGGTLTVVVALITCGFRRVR